MFSFICTDSFVYQKLVVVSRAYIQRVSTLYFKLINKRNVQPTICVEMPIGLLAFKEEFLIKYT